MRSLVYVFPYALVFWAVFVWAFVPEFVIVTRSRRGGLKAGSPDAGSLSVILLGMWVALAAAFPMASVSSLQFPAGTRRWTFWSGLGILVAGSLLRRHCWRMLGAHFTGEVRVAPDQPVVTAGAYAFVRHPSYTGGTLMNMGIGIALGSWASALLLTVASLIVYAYRIQVEERALLATLGEPYGRFMATRKRLIPYIY